MCVLHNGRGVLLMYFLMQKRVQSTAADQTGSKLHRWARASATAKVAKNKLGMPLFLFITAVSLL